MAPPKTRTEFSHLLTPAVFLSAISQALGVVPEPKSRTKSQSSLSSSDRNNNDNNNNNNNSNSNININDNSPQPQQQQYRREVLFTNEAIEALRRCHGEFIALVASDLVSRKEDEFQKRQQQQQLRITNGANNRKREKRVPTVSEKAAESRVHTVTPKEVRNTLTNLDFQDIVSEIGSGDATASKSAVDPSSGSHNRELSCDATSTATTAIAEDVTTVTNDSYPDSGITTKTKDDAAMRVVGSRRVKRRDNRGTLQRKKFKKAYQNDKVTADLLKEQERLFASSAAKARIHNPPS